MGYKNAMGQIGKCVLVFMIVVLGFVMRGELFQATLINSVFASYPAMYSNIGEDELTPFVNSLEQDTEATAVSCFFAIWENDSRLEHKLKIYTNDNTLKTSLEENNGLSEGITNSFVSGSTEIEFLPLTDLTYDVFRTNPYVLIKGSSEAESLIYEELKDEYDVSYPRILQSEETDMILIVWGMIAIFLILINGSMILRKKKEMLIRTIYGEDIVKITMYSFLKDFVTYELIYFLAKFFVSFFITGDYKPELAFFIYQIGVIVAVGLNFIYLRLNFRAVLSNATDNEGTLGLLYVLKVVAFVVVLFTLVTNFSSLQKTILSNESDNMYSLYQKDMFLSIFDYGLEKNSSEERMGDHNIWNTLYTDEYDTIRPVISIKLADARNPILVMNEYYASPLLPESLDVANEEGIVVLYPEGRNVLKEDVGGLLGLCLDESQDIVWTEQAYDIPIQVPYIATNDLTGFQEASNPIIFYCGKEVKLSPSAFGDNRDILYDMTEEELSLLDQRLGMTAQGYQIVTTNMGEFYEYQMSLVMRIVRFLSSLCMLVLVLNMAICITLCKMEYRIFGMDYALKKF